MRKQMFRVNNDINRGSPVLAKSKTKRKEKKNDHQFHISWC